MQPLVPATRRAPAPPHTSRAQRFRRALGSVVDIRRGGGYAMVELPKTVSAPGWIWFALVLPLWLKLPLTVRLLM